MFIWFGLTFRLFGWLIIAGKWTRRQFHNRVWCKYRGVHVESVWLTACCWWFQRGYLNNRCLSMYNLAKAYRSIKNPLPIAESRTGKPAMVILKIQPDCSTVHDTFMWANIYVRSHLGCGTDSVSSVFCRSHKYFKDAKVMQINRILKKS